MPQAKKPKTKGKSDAAPQEADPKATAGDPKGIPAEPEVAPEGVAVADNGELLQLMWSAQVRALLAILNTTDPVAIPAATLATIQRFLADNNVNAETVERRAQELKRMQTLVTDFRDNPPAFHDPDDHDGAKAFARSQAWRG